MKNARKSIPETRPPTALLFSETRSCWNEGSADDAAQVCVVIIVKVGEYELKIPVSSVATTAPSGPAFADQTVSVEIWSCSQMIPNGMCQSGRFADDGRNEFVQKPVEIELCWGFGETWPVAMTISVLVRAGMADWHTLSVHQFSEYGPNLTASQSAVEYVKPLPRVNQISSLDIFTHSLQQPSHVTVLVVVPEKSSQRVWMRGP